MFSPFRRTTGAAVTARLTGPLSFPIQLSPCHRRLLTSSIPVRYTHAVLRRALKQAKRWGMVNRNVAEDVDPPRLKRDEIRPLDREKTRTLLQAAEGDRLHAFYVVAVTGGLRPGEMLGLRWGDVGLGDGTVRINP